MKLLNVFVVFFAVALITAGCAKKKESVHLETLDGLEKELDNAESMLEGVDTAMIKQIDRDILDKVTKLGELKGGAMHEVNSEVAGFVSIRRPILSFFRDYNSNRESIERFRDEFDVLRNNFQKGDIDETVLGVKVYEKKGSLEMFCGSLQRNIDNINEKLVAYDTLAPIINKRVGL